ncbi:MAG TPA: hypothetical protein VJP06_00715 [Thermoplasmata archaeon]|nr:hypothetical protein [Thermoplasmata archaeon]
MVKDRSWWRLRQIRHRDAVVLAVLSASFLLAGELINNDIRRAYTRYIEPYATDPPRFVLNVALTILGFTTYFGGIFVLLGGLHFSWGRVARGRFLTGLGVGVSLLGLVSRLAQATLDVGTPVSAFAQLTATVTGFGILLGVASHSLMGKYALMLKKHAKRVWRRWRKTRKPDRRSSRS